MISADAQSQETGRSGSLTIDQLVDHHEVVLHRFFINLPKVSLANVDKAVTEFEDKSCVCIRPTRALALNRRTTDNQDILCNSNNIEVVHSDVEKARRSESNYGGPHVAVRHDLYPEHVGNGSSRIWRMSS